jgi:hypothetical protein
MGANSIIVREYLETLSENQELDKVFPLLLSTMGFRIVSTPIESKGQSQYGKDIIAIKKSEDGIFRRYYFELKGEADKNINDHVFSKADGIRDSLLAMRYAKFEESSIPGFAAMPIMFVMVHNGILLFNTRPTFDGFVNSIFNEGTFERWDIHKLTELFSDYLFGEYLLTDKESVRLFKKTLVLLDVPDYDLQDFKMLLTKIMTDDIQIKTRRFRKMFSTIHLLSNILLHYCVEADNLEPAKNGISHVVLSTWSWILRNNLDKRKVVKKEFGKLLRIHHDVLDRYFKKTLPAAVLLDGLSSERGGPFEVVGYPLRAMEFVNYLMYFFVQRHSWPRYDGKTNEAKRKRLEKRQLDLLFKILEGNDGCCRPLIDRHSLPILLVYLFCKNSLAMSANHLGLLRNFFVNIINNINLVANQRHRFPEFYNNIEALIVFNATHKRPYDYYDKSSHLILILAEISAIEEYGDIYAEIRNFSEEINLQTANPLFDDGYDLEQMYIQQNIYEQMTVETSIELPEDPAVLLEQLKAKYERFKYRTDQSGFSFLRYLAAIYNYNDLFPDEWRKYIREVSTT